MKRLLVIVLVVVLTALLATNVMAKPGCGDGDTIVAGMCGRYDADNNGYPDAGVSVVGHYTSVYAYDTLDWYWDLGDGRVQGTVGSIADLDPATLTTCDYVVNYRATFGNDPFMDSGWIQNLINCYGFDDNGQYNYLIVHRTDPRYEGNPAWAVWGDWEYHVLTESHSGNLVRPEHAVGN
jgi:hypothetical protein